MRVPGLFLLLILGSGFLLSLLPADAAERLTGFRPDQLLGRHVQLANEHAVAILIGEPTKIGRMVVYLRLIS